MLTDSVSRVHIPLSLPPALFLTNVSFSLCSTDVDSITLNWNKVSKATGYQVEMYTNGTWKTLSTLSGTSYTASDLSQNTAYRFRVRAIRNYNYINYYGGYTEKEHHHSSCKHT